MFKNKRLAIDLGSTTTRVWDEKRGLVFEEPSVIAVDIDTNKTVAYGQDAMEMSGRSPDGIDIVWPLSSGVIANYGAATKLLEYAIKSNISRIRMSKPEAVLSISSGATSTEKRALLDAGRDAGLQHVFLIKSSLAGAIGAELPIDEALGNIIIDIGGGTTEIGVYSLGGAVVEKSIKFAGNAFEEAILRCIRREHGMIVGREELQRITYDFAGISDEAAKTLNIHGQDIIQGLPKTATLNLRQLQPYLLAVLERIELAIRSVLEQTPPDLLSDTIKHGVLMVGGGSLLNGIDDHLAKKFSVAFIRAKDPRLTVVKGVSLSTKNVDEYRKSLIS